MGPGVRRNTTVHPRPSVEIAWSVKKGDGRRSLSLGIPERKALLVVGDLLLVNGTYLLSLMGGTSAIPSAPFPELLLSYTAWFVSLSILWIFVARIDECYDIRAVAKLSVAGTRIFLALVHMGVIYIVLFYFVQFPLLPRTILPIFLVSSLALLLLWRLLYVLIFRMPPFKRRVLIVGAGWAGRVIAGELTRHLRGEYALLGFIDDDPDKQAQIVEKTQVLGTRTDLLRLAQELGVQELVLSITHDVHGELYEALIEAQERGIAVTPMALLYENLTDRVPVEHINDYWYTGLPVGPNHNTLYLLSKRSMDIVVSLLGLAATGFLMPFVALAIRLDSPGPIFYTQERVGRNGQPFQLVKFRSMFQDAEAEGKAVWAVENDTRVTRVGRFLRVTRMDELPQFLNILRGELSMVGPRPERPAFVDELQRHIPFYRSRFLAKPGLTGWAQIKYGYGNTLEDALIKLQYDLFYIKHQSLLMDVLISLKTFWVVVSCKGT